MNMSTKRWKDDLESLNATLFRVSSGIFPELNYTVCSKSERWHTQASSYASATAPSLMTAPEG